MEVFYSMAASFDKGWTSHYYMLLAGLVFADLFLGFSRAISLKKFNSTIGLAGITKHVTVLVVPMLLYPFVDVMGYGSVADGIIAFLALSEGGSVLENWIAMGLPFKEEWRRFFDEKKLEQKERVGTVHTDEELPHENDKIL